MHQFIKDVRYAIRGLIRKPGLAITAVTALGLGIGLTTAMFSIVNGVVLRGLPMEEPEEIVAINRINPCTVMAAVKLIKKGKTAVLGKIYQSDAPFFGVRGFNLTIPALPTGGPFPGGLIYNDEMVTTEIGQVGTQFDGPGHIGVRTADGRDLFYNGQNLQEVGGAYGVGSLGVDQVGAKA